MVEHLGQRPDLGPCETERPSVDHVDRVDAIVGQHPLDLADGLIGGQVPGHADPAESVADDQVAAVVGKPAKTQPAVLDANLDPVADAEPQPIGVDSNHPGIDLGHQAARAGPHALQVAGQGECPAPRWYARSGRPAG